MRCPKFARQLRFLLGAINPARFWRRLDLSKPPVSHSNLRWSNSVCECDLFFGLSHFLSHILSHTPSGVLNLSFKIND